MQVMFVVHMSTVLKQNLYRFYMHNITVHMHHTHIYIYIQEGWSEVAMVAQERALRIWQKGCETRQSGVK